jgi:hypothetical protein
MVLYNISANNSGCSTERCASATYTISTKVEGTDHEVRHLLAWSVTRKSSLDGNSPSRFTQEAPYLVRLVQFGRLELNERLRSWRN